MNDVVVRTPMQYLDKATAVLRDLGLMPAKLEPAPINALLEKISSLEPDKIQVIARTLGYASVFNEIVREQIAGMEIGERYKTITSGFDSIRDDAKRMVDQLTDSKLDLLERATNVWMKISRGDVADRFDKLRATYLDVTKDTKDQVDREHAILESYRDYRGALKQAEVHALEVLKTATGKLEEARTALKTATDKVAQFAGKEPAERARLAQTTSAKERIYAQSITFFSTNDTVLTALKASFTGLFGLHESTATLNAMKEGVSKSLETLSEIGDKVQEEALRAGYGPTIRADAVKKLVESVVNYQERAQSIIEEMRKAATQNSAEIRDSVEDGKRRIAKLVADGKALPA
jgi:chromosome segregation ATPase